MGSNELVNSTPLFRNLTADDPDPETTEIESLCMNCGENVGLSTFVIQTR